MSNYRFLVAAASSICFLLAANVAHAAGNGKGKGPVKDKDEEKTGGVPSLATTICKVTDLDGFTSLNLLVNPLTCASFSGNDAGDPQSEWLGKNYFPAGWSNHGTTDEPGSAGPFGGVDQDLDFFTSDSPLTGAFSIILKGGNQFSVYNFNTTESIVRFEYTNGGMDNKGLSHVSLWKGPADCVDTATCDPAFVPEPASLALFASGLFGLGVIARRRRES